MGSFQESAFVQSLYIRLAAFFGRNSLAALVHRRDILQAIVAFPVQAMGEDVS